MSPAGDSCSAFIRLGEEKKKSSQSLKICGYMFGNKSDVSEQIKSIEKKFNERAWLLRNLKRAGFNSGDLKTAYTSIVRPVFNFTAVVYHSLSTNEQKSRLERLQARALSIVTEKHHSYERTLFASGLPTLNDRRLALINNFINKSLSHPVFTHDGTQSRTETHTKPDLKKDT